MVTPDGGSATLIRKRCTTPTQADSLASHQGLQDRRDDGDPAAGEAGLVDGLASRRYLATRGLQHLRSRSQNHGLHFSQEAHENLGGVITRLLGQLL